MGSRRFNRMGELGIVLVLVCLGGAADAGAHAPYEHPVRTISGPDGRPLHLVKSYVDGIFFTDPETRRSGRGRSNLC
jgi:hypothetical protein